MYTHKENIHHILLEFLKRNHRLFIRATGSMCGAIQGRHSEYSTGGKRDMSGFLFYQYINLSIYQSEAVTGFKSGEERFSRTRKGTINRQNDRIKCNNFLTRFPETIVSAKIYQHIVTS